MDPDEYEAYRVASFSSIRLDRNNRVIHIPVGFRLEFQTGEVALALLSLIIIYNWAIMRPVVEEI